MKRCAYALQQVWDMIMHHLARKSLIDIYHSSLCCARLVQSHVNSRITRHLASAAPYKLRLILSDPASMQGCEFLELAKPRALNRQNLPGSMDHRTEVITWQGNHTRLSISCGQNFSVSNLDTQDVHDDLRVASPANYSKSIQLDDLDFLYQICFDIHRCIPRSLIAVANLCGERMRMLRLWKYWFTEAEAQTASRSVVSGMKLFTKLVWVDSNFDIGFIISAHGSICPDNCHLMAPSSETGGLFRDPRTYRIELEEVIIRDSHLIGLFEGFNI